MQRRNSLAAMLIMLIAGLMLISCNFSGPNKIEDGQSITEGFLEYTYDKQSDSYSVSGGYTRWDKDEVPKELTIPGTFRGKPVTAITAPFIGLQGLEKITIEDGIILISDYAFNSLYSLNTVVLPDTLSYIGSSAFADTALVQIVIPDSVMLTGDSIFQNCSSIESISVPFYRTPNTWDYSWDFGIPESTVINYNYGNTGLAFVASISGGYACAGLPDGAAETSVTIPAEYKGLPVDTIISYAFKDNLMVQEITLPDSIEYIDNYAFDGCENLIKINLPDGLTEIGEMAFGTCYNLSQTVLPESLEIIGDYAFFGCNNLPVHKLPENLREIGEMAFHSTLADFTEIPASVEYIGDHAFSNAKMTEITIPETVKYLGSSAFSHANDLKTVYTPYIHTIPDTWNGWDEGIPETAERKVIDPDKISYALRSYYDGGEEKYYYVVDGLSPESTLSDVKIESEYNGWPVTEIFYEAFRGVTSLKSIEVPESVTKIADNAFIDCTNLSKIVLPDSITEIGEYTFQNCSSLTAIELPDSVESLAGNFDGCTALASVTLPENLKELGTYTFRNCTSLKDLELPDGLETIITAVFKGSGIESLSIPASVKTVYYKAFEGCNNLKEITVAWEEGNAPEGWTSDWASFLPEGCTIKYEPTQGGDEPGGDEDPDNPGGDLDDQMLALIQSQLDTGLSYLTGQIQLGNKPSGVTTDPSDPTDFMLADEYTVTMNNASFTSGDTSFVMTGTLEFSRIMSSDGMSYTSVEKVNLTEGTSIDGEPHTASWTTNSSMENFQLTTETVDVIVDGQSITL